MPAVRPPAVPVSGCCSRPLAGYTQTQALQVLEEALSLLTQAQPLAQEEAVTLLTQAQPLAHALPVVDDAEMLHLCLSQEALWV